MDSTLLGAIPDRMRADRMLGFLASFSSLQYCRSLTARKQLNRARFVGKHRRFVTENPDNLAVHEGAKTLMTPFLRSDIPGFPCRRGKVRDVYDLGDRLVIIATDRISAFDWVLPTGIPD